MGEPSSMFIRWASHRIMFRACCTTARRCMYSSCLVEARSENHCLTKATLEIVARVRWLVCFPCRMRSVCCYFPAWPKLQHMWSCAWLASTGMGDDAGGGLGEGCSVDSDGGRGEVGPAYGEVSFFGPLFCMTSSCDHQVY